MVVVRAGGEQRRTRPTSLARVSLLVLKTSARSVVHVHGWLCSSKNAPKNARRRPKSGPNVRDVVRRSQTKCHYMKVLSRVEPPKRSPREPMTFCRNERKRASDDPTSTRFRQWVYAFEMGTDVIENRLLTLRIRCSHIEVRVTIPWFPRMLPLPFGFARPAF